MANRNADLVETQSRQLISKAFLIAALVLFVTWHFLPCFDDPEQGWHVWPSIWRTLLDPESLTHNPQAAIAIASILNFSLLILVSPFLMQVWSKSPLAWWFATIFSGLAAAGFWGIFVIAGEAQSPHLGGWCVLLAPLLNFFGLLLARGKKPPAPESAPI